MSEINDLNDAYEDDTPASGALKLNWDFRMTDNKEGNPIVKVIRPRELTNVDRL
ncbi:hypothetical protein TrVFT333_005865 [Trichoderma virens FT-333]|nr:hypothetical protein TrVFT333_005865 [Trichoderma virens FT-333]